MATLHACLAIAACCFAAVDSKPRLFHAMLSAYAAGLIYFFPACNQPPAHTAYDDIRDLRELRQPVRVPSQG